MMTWSWKWGRTRRALHRRAAGEVSIAGAPVSVPLDYVVDETGSPAAPQRSAPRAQRRGRDELADLSDAIRADVGLPLRSPQWRDELRFLATPERTGLLQRDRAD